jgi:molecular chaperone GrpE (heat shock protein)
MIDLQRAIDTATHLDLDTIYQSLLEGSKSHLRAFVSALKAKGVTYQPQYISVELYNAIINT